MSSTKEPQQALYPNSPLSEVASEVRFAAEPMVEAYRYKYYDAIRDKYPKVLVPEAGEKIAPLLQPYRFERGDGIAATQLAINSLSYYERMYRGSKSFSKEFLRLYKIMLDLFPIKSINRVGWRYINAIPFVREEGLIPLGTFFGTTPILSPFVEGRYEDLSLRASLPYEDVAVNIRLESAIQPGDQEDVIIFDIDAYVLRSHLGGKLDASAMPKTIERLHSRARTIFEEAITEYYRSYLKGETYG